MKINEKEMEIKRSKIKSKVRKKTKVFEKKE